MGKIVTPIYKNSISKSVKNSFKEVKLMRAGKKEKTSLDTLFDNIDMWTRAK